MFYLDLFMRAQLMGIRVELPNSPNITEFPPRNLPRHVHSPTKLNSSAKKSKEGMEHLGFTIPDDPHMGVPPARPPRSTRRLCGTRAAEKVPVTVA